MSFDEMMKNLKKEYVRDLPQKVETIRQFCEKGDVASLREEFHKLKGTGKTYGLPEVSELCAALEQICVNQAVSAVSDSKSALGILVDIHQARLKDQTYHLLEDPRFLEIQKHLAS